MKPELPSDPDKLLHRTLREWEIKEPLPPRFGERVWQRIAREEAQAPASVWTRLPSWLAQALARPTLAVSYVTALLVAGLLAGYWHGQSEKARTYESLGARYVQMMNPYQTHAMNR